MGVIQAFIAGAAWSAKTRWRGGVKIRSFVGKPSAAMLSGPDLMRGATYHRRLQSWAQKPRFYWVKAAPQSRPCPILAHCRAWRRAKQQQLGERLPQEFPLIASEAFISSSFDSFIPPALVVKARKQRIEDDFGWGLIVGVDPAGMGRIEQALPGCVGAAF